jgi:hypothetical protein
MMNDLVTRGDLTFFVICAGFMNWVFGCQISKLRQEVSHLKKKLEEVNLR